MPAGRGSIAFFGTYRPPVPLDIYTSPIKASNSKEEEELMTDGKSYNYNGQVIPKASLDAILQRPKLASSSSVANNNVKSGMVFVSERTNGLETLHLALRFDDGNGKPEFEVLSFDDVYEDAFKGVRMEDSPCFAGDYLIYVSTKEAATQPRQPWTAVYRTNLQTGKTDRLTPTGTADLSPSVSPSGKKIAVASFQFKHGGWTGEIEDLKTDIVLMDIDGSKRKLIVSNGGWPTWGSEDILFFHRGVETVAEVIDTEKKTKKKKLVKKWGVFQANISCGFSFETKRVTPEDIDAMTPAAISATTVAVATIREKLGAADIRKKIDQYRHIEIFDTTKLQQYSTKVTQNITPMGDHYNPFLTDGNYIGYHRCRSGNLAIGDVPREFDELKCPNEDVGLLRVSGVFPSFSSDGKKLAFVDNDFKKVWLADHEGGLRPICTMSGRNKVFCPVWNQNPNKDTLYICHGKAFEFETQVVIEAIQNASLDYGQGNEPPRQQLTENKCNSAFPSSNPEGTKLVFRSTRDWVGVGKPFYRNLYIMDADSGDYLTAKPTRLTNGKWMDTMCEWSPKGDWIVFSSTRDKPEGAPDNDNGLDPGYYAVFLLSVNNPSVVIRVIGSREFDIAGHVNHPCFSPDGKSIVFTADLAAVSADPISMPIFAHSVRPYGDIFSIDLNDPNDIQKNENIKNVTRITHSRYENATPFWNVFSISLISKYYKQNY